MNILLVNQKWFAEEFAAAGHNVLSCGINRSLDVDLKAPLLHIDTIIKDLLGGFKPDVILILDNSAPIVIEGLDQTEIPIVFYSVDAHHHVESHKYLAHVFDHTLVAQKDYMQAFEEVGAQAEWLPLWSSRYMEASTKKEHGAVFVGTLKAELNRERVVFFEKLQSQVPLLCMTGAYWKIYPFSEIVINQTVKGDLNFRVFEAMMSGAMLLTEYAPNGLCDLFEPDRHLVTYTKGKAQEAAEKIQWHLDHPKEMREIAHQGREEILAKHTAQHRADHVLSILENVQKKENSPVKYLSWMTNFCVLSHRLEKIDSALSGHALVSAMKAAEMGLRQGEPLDENLSMRLVYVCGNYDQKLNSDAGLQMLETAAGVYPDVPLLKFAILRDLLNSGKQDRAKAIAREIAPIDERETFQHAENIVSAILYPQ